MFPLSCEADRYREKDAGASTVQSDGSRWPKVIQTHQCHETDETLPLLTTKGQLSITSKPLRAMFRDQLNSKFPISYSCAS